MSLKVLVVDDEREMVSFVEHLLQREGFLSCGAYDGVEAKEKFNSFNPEVILLDIMMPKCDGLKFLEWVRKEKKSKIPVIIVSAKDKMDDVKKGYTFDADYYIIKPIKAQDLVKGIKTVTSIKHYYDQDEKE